MENVIISARPETAVVLKSDAFVTFDSLLAAALYRRSRDVDRAHREIPLDRTCGVCRIDRANCDVTKDKRDLLSCRPFAPSNRVQVTIDLSECDNSKKDRFSKYFNDESLSALRDAIGEPDATVLYTKKVSIGPDRAGLFSPIFDYPRYVQISSVVQTDDDISHRDDGSLDQT